MYLQKLWRPQAILVAAVLLMTAFGSVITGSAHASVVNPAGASSWVNGVIGNSFNKVAVADTAPMTRVRGNIGHVVSDGHGGLTVAWLDGLNVTVTCNGHVLHLTTDVNGLYEGFYSTTDCGPGSNVYTSVTYTSPLTNGPTQVATDLGGDPYFDESWSVAFD